MDRLSEVIARIEPEVSQRQCGGWMATAPKWAPLKIGVVGDSETEARANFAISLKQWSNTLAPTD